MSRPSPLTVEALIRQRLAAALGGWRGSVEAALPTLAFVGVWTWRHDLMTAVVAALVVAVILAAARLVQRSSLQYVGGAVFATAIAAVFALRSGRAEDAFLPGMIWNAVLGGLALLSIATRWPMVGFIVGAGDPRLAEDPVAWRRDPGLVRVAIRLTWIMVALFVIRVAIMYPLWLAGNVAALGVAKIALGWPLWIAGIGVMGTLLFTGHTPLDPGPNPAPDELVDEDSTPA